MASMKSMESMNPEATNRIPSQVPIPWRVAFSLAWSSLRRRFLRSLITMFGVILAIAFLTYMQVTDAILLALIAARDDALNVLLQKAGIDIFAGGGTSPMMLLLLGLSLLTCLVGIVNSMMMAVTERIKEIGTLKCRARRTPSSSKPISSNRRCRGSSAPCWGLPPGCWWP